MIRKNEDNIPAEDFQHPSFLYIQPTGTKKKKDISFEKNCSQNSESNKRTKKIHNMKIIMQYCVLQKRKQNKYTKILNLHCQK